MRRFIFTVAVSISIAVPSTASGAFVEPRDAEFEPGSLGFRGTVDIGGVCDHFIPTCVDAALPHELPPRPAPTTSPAPFSPPRAQTPAGVVPPVTAPVVPTPHAATAGHAQRKKTTRRHDPSHPGASQTKDAFGTSPSPIARAPVQVAAAIAPSVPGGDTSGPPLGFLIAAIALLGAFAVLVLRLRPDWFIRGVPPSAG
jgi:hypothetical protein